MTHGFRRNASSSKMRLTYGPFERIGSQVAVKRARLQFLWNAKARVPEITNDLHQTCYPLYQEFLADQTKTAPRSYDGVGDSPGWNAVVSSKQTKGLLKRLKEWSENYHLVAEWPIRAAVTAMKAWSTDEEALHFRSWCKESETIRFLLFPQFYPHVRFPAEYLRELRWTVHQMGIVDFGPDDEIFLFECDADPSTSAVTKDSCQNRPSKAWEPPPSLPLWWFASTSREEYLRDVETQAREAIENSAPLSCIGTSHQNHYVREVMRVAATYCDKVDAYISKQGDWKRVKVFVDHRAHLKHISWAVRFQIEGKSYSEIAREMRNELDEEPSVSTVKRGVGEVLDMIGLDFDRRRDVKRGPKLGSVLSSATKVRSKTLRSLGSDTPSIVS